MNIGIIGAGHIAAKMSRTIEKMTGVCRYAVASRDLQKARDFAAEYGFEAAYGSYEELCRDPKVDLVYVATPHSHHFAHVKMCIEHSKPVLCEKSFTANADEAQELMRLSRERKVFLAEAMWTRYMPFSRTIKETLESGIIGKPEVLSANLGYSIEWKERIVKPELCGGALLDLGVYCINFADICFGLDITEIKSCCVKNDLGVDMQETISFVYRDGRIANLCASARCATDRQGIISGSEGFMIVDNINNPQNLSVYDKHSTLLKKTSAPPCISGYEYEVYACKDALEKGLSQSPYFPLERSVLIMDLMDSLRKEWGVRFPMDR